MKNLFEDVYQLYLKGADNENIEKDIQELANKYNESYDYIYEVLMEIASNELEK